MMNDLGFDLVGEERGGGASISRSLRPADLDRLAGFRAVTPVPLVKRVSERHHSLARLLAAGVKPGEAAIILGYHPSRVSILQSDPAFKELMFFYRKNVDLEYAEVHQRMAGLSKEALAELTERLEQSPEKFSTQALIELLTVLADRTGHGPQTTTKNLNVNVDLGDRLAAARKRVQLG